jgi:hypothetical protein
MKPITVEQLKEECEKQIKLGRGDNVIMITQDDEGNGYHYLWYSFCEISKLEEPFQIGDKTYTEEIWTDDEIAPHDKTIILG